MQGSTVRPPRGKSDGPARGKSLARLRRGTCGKSEPSGKSGDRTAPERKRCRARQFDLLAEKVMARLRRGTCGKSEPSGKSGDRTAPERKRCRARQFDLLAEKVMARLRRGTCGKSEPSGKSGDRTAPERKRCRARQFDLLAEKVMARLRSGKGEGRAGFARNGPIAGAWPVCAELPGIPEPWRLGQFVRNCRNSQKRAGRMFCRQVTPSRRGVRRCRVCRNCCTSQKSADRGLRSTGDQGDADADVGGTYGDIILRLQVAVVADRIVVAAVCVCGAVVVTRVVVGTGGRVAAPAQEFRQKCRAGVGEPARAKVCTSRVMRSTRSFRWDWRRTVGR